MDRSEMIRKSKENPLYKSFIKHRLSMLFLFGCIIGAILFICIYGVKVLNPTYDDWLMNGFDLTQHYLGWKFYRVSSWSFPIGMTQGLIYPYENSIIYTDSIPLFAVIFKILSPILPQTFQYFGIWGILCFMLQGGLGAVLVKRFTDSDLIPLFSSVLFSFSPLVLQRMYYHSALAGQWMILLPLCVWAYRKYFNTVSKNIIVWSVICVLCALVQLYFLPMAVIILCGYLLQDFIETKKLLKQVVVLTVPMVCTLAVLVIFGAFSGGKTILSDIGLGLHSYNLNGLFNSQYNTVFLKELPISTHWQSNEGYSYLGFGVILLLGFGTVFKIVNLYQNSRRHIRTVHDELKERWAFLLPTAICSFIFIVLAVSPTVTFNSATLFTIPYPQFILAYLEIFRSSARFIWPVFYGVMLLSIVLVSKNSRKILAISLIFICTCLQLVDLSKIAYGKHEIYSKQVVYDNGLSSEVWDELAVSNRHIFFYQNNYVDLNHLYAIADYAYDSGMTLNSFYLSRSFIIDENLEYHKTNLENGTPVDETIYFFASKTDAAYLNGIYLYQVDDRIIGLKNPIENIEDYPDVTVLDLSQSVDFTLEDEENEEISSKVLAPSDTYTTSKMTVPSGSYELKITGTNLGGSSYQLNSSTNEIDSELISEEDLSLDLKFTVMDANLNFQFAMTNDSTENLCIQKITIIKLND